MTNDFLSSLRLLTITSCFAFTHAASAQSTAEPLKTVVPVLLNVATGSITVGSTVYPGGSPGLHLLALSRQPDTSHLDAPDYINSQTFTDASSANEFLQNVLARTPDAILILNAVGNYSFALSAIAKNLEQFGSATDIEGVAGPIQFVFIGNGGLNVAGAHQRGFSNLNMSGYLATDSNGNYTFVQPDYVKFDIGLDGSIAIGVTTYTVAGSGKVAGCNGSNAFHVVAVQREAPGVLIGNESYCTAQSDGEITHIITDLSGLVGSESNLVFIASSGHPIPANWNFGTDGDARIYPLAQLIAQLGGYWETMVYLTPTDTFSLVGATAPPAGTLGARKRGRESSSVYPNHPTGELHGVLARGLRGDWYSPLNADPTGQANLGFYEILGQQPVPFPHPANSAELAAFQSISNQLCGAPGTPCNIRNKYADTSVSMNVYLTLLEAISDSANDDCSNPKNVAIPFCIVKQQLKIEFQYVADIRGFNQNLTNVWLGSGTTTILEMLSTYNNIQATLPAPPPATPAPSLAGPIVNLFLGLASAIPEVGPVFGIADTLFNFGTSLTTDPSGNQTINLSSTVSNLQSQAAQHFNAEATTTGTQFDFIYQDWGKINTLGAALAQAQQGSPWFWNGNTTTGQILNAMAPAIEQSYYQSLMAAIYSVGSYVPSNWGDTPVWQQPQSYYAGADNWQGFFGAQPFNCVTNSCWYHPYTFPLDADNPYNVSDDPTSTLLGAGGWLGISTQNTPAEPQSPTWLYQAPAASVLTQLFKPRSQGGLGVYRPTFFEGWPFPRIACDSSYDDNGDPGQGCDWGSAAPPPEALPGALTKISIRDGRASRSGTQLDLPLTITNTGTVDATSIHITKLTLRTLAGSGNATVESPAVPVDVGTLSPGAITKIMVHLSVPSTVKKLSLTENGTVETGELVPYKFSLGQVIFPLSEK